MKNPLNYQTTEYDCGPTTMMNAISYLFKREEIPPDIIKCIMQYCLDGYNKKGEAYKSGTTDMAMFFLSHWLNQYGQMRKFPIHCENLMKEEVFIGSSSKVSECLYQKGVVVAKVMLGCWHYVLLTGIDGGMNRIGKEDYALGELDCRECVLLYNTDTRQTMDQIEYII